MRSTSVLTESASGSINADAFAKGFCDLLVLDTFEFKKLIDAHPHMKKIIEKTARERLFNT